MGIMPTMSLIFSALIIWLWRDTWKCPMPLAHSSFHDTISTSSNNALFGLSTMPPAHSSSLIAWFVHPSLLHRLTFAPCLMHTPPRWTWLVHPSVLHSLIATFAPCFLHTPPFLAWFVHPSVEPIFTTLIRVRSSSLEDDFRFRSDCVWLLLSFEFAAVDLISQVSAVKGACCGELLFEMLSEGALSSLLSLIASVAISSALLSWLSRLC